MGVLTIGNTNVFLIENIYLFIYLSTLPYRRPNYKAGEHTKFLKTDYLLL